MQKNKNHFRMFSRSFFIHCEEKWNIFPCQLRFLLESNKKSRNDTIAKSWTLWSRKRAGNGFAVNSGPESKSELFSTCLRFFFQLIFWFLNWLGGFCLFRSRVRNNKLSCDGDLYENINRFLIFTFSVGRLHSIEPHWQVFGSTLSTLSRVHERCLDSASTRYSCVHIPRWPHVVRADLSDSSSRDYREDQTKVFHCWYGESFETAHSHDCGVTKKAPAKAINHQLIFSLIRHTECQEERNMNKLLISSRLQVAVLQKRSSQTNFCGSFA